MPTTTDQLTWARSWMGNTETDDVFNERYDRNYAQVAIDPAWTGRSLLDRQQEALVRAIDESLRGQMAVMTLDEPSSASAEGNSYSNVQNIVQLSKNWELFRSTNGTSGGMVLGAERVSRCGFRRSR